MLQGLDVLPEVLLTFSSFPQFLFHKQLMEGSVYMASIHFSLGL